jgi:hypothetical protein
MMMYARVHGVQGMNTALHLACEQGHCKIIEMLLKASANGKIVNHNNKTAFEVGTDNSKQTINRIAPQFAGDMYSTMESMDQEMLDELMQAGKLHGTASFEMNAITNNRRAARAQQEAERSGQLAFELDKDGKTVYVNIQKCSKLKDMDTFGSNDVFVVVNLNGEQQRTKTLPDVGATAVWNQGRGQVLKFKGAKTISSLILRVFDEDVSVGGFTAELIGSFTFPEHRLEHMQEEAEDDGYCADVVLRVGEEAFETEVGTTSEKYLVNGKDPNASETFNPLAKLKDMSSPRAGEDDT